MGETQQPLKSWGGRMPKKEPVKWMVLPTGFEPVTFGLGNHCSIQLSYGSIWLICNSLETLI